MSADEVNKAGSAAESTVGVSDVGVAGATSGVGVTSGAEGANDAQIIIAPGVVETIVALAVSQVDGVAAVGAKNPSGIISAIAKKHAVNGVLILEEDGQIAVDLHVSVFYGFKLQEIATHIREAVADALLGQACIEIAVVNITIDGIVFAG
jgi:uncharacterized alkaline shock family protein YloU